MRKVNIDFLKPGSISGQNIYSLKTRRKLISKGMNLAEDYIRSLKKMGISHVYIEDELSEGIDVAEMIPDEMHWQVKQTIYNTYQNVQNDGEIKDTRVISRNVKEIIGALLSANEIVTNLSDIRIVDDYTYVHSVNACILAVMCGMSMAFNDVDLYNLAIGALLHDMGKTKVPPEILNKPERLTDEEMQIIRKHPEYGFEILKKCDDLSRNSVFVALAHHEWVNGQGYPRGIAGDEIHRFARIVSVCDVFDSMMSDRVYRKGMELPKVVNYLKLMAGKQFDAEIVDRFVDKVVIYPNGTGVRLNTNEVGIVVKSAPENRYRPLVRIVLDEKGNRLKDFREVDLTADESYSIVGVFNEF